MMAAGALAIRSSNGVGAVGGFVVAVVGLGGRAVVVVSGFGFLVLVGLVSVEFGGWLDRPVGQNVDPAGRELDGDVGHAPASRAPPRAGAMRVMLDTGGCDGAGWQAEGVECAGDSLAVGHGIWELVLISIFGGEEGGKWHAY